MTARDRFHYNLICNVCRDEDAERQVKAGCGHLVHICHECESQIDHIRHSKCRGCVMDGNGQRTPEDILAEEANMYDKHLYPTYDDDYLDDYFFDDFDEPRPLEPDYNDPNDPGYDMFDDL